jgi:hypothetical protein
MRDQFQEHRPLQVSQVEATEYFRLTAKPKTKIKLIVRVLRLLFPSGASAKDIN